MYNKNAQNQSSCKKLYIGSKFMYSFDIYPNRITMNQKFQKPDRSERRKNSIEIWFLY